MDIRDTLTQAQVQEALKRELPGFESRLLVEDRDQLIVVEAKGPVWFYGKMNIDPFTLPIPTYERNEAFAELLREMVRKTRAHAIEQLGLDKEIRAQVEEKTRAAVAEQKVQWEQKGWRDGYAAATKELVVTMRDALLAPPQALTPGTR